MTTIIALILSLILPACPTEDSQRCVWHSEGSGSSFVTYGPEESQVWLRLPEM